MKKRWTSGLLSLLLVLLLFSGCSALEALEQLKEQGGSGNSDSSVSESVPIPSSGSEASPAPESAPAPSSGSEEVSAQEQAPSSDGEIPACPEYVWMTEEEDTALLALRDEITRSGNLVGIAYMGYVDSESGEVDLRDYVAHSELGNQYPFLNTAWLWIGEGDELYAIVPGSENVTITLFSADMTQSGEYMVDRSMPIEGFPGEVQLVKCNVSDLYSNVLVSVTDGNETIEVYPGLSMEDGRLAKDPGVYDFSIYETEIGEAEVQDAFDQLLQTEEIQMAMQQGMSLMYTDTTEMINGQVCLVFALGTDHDEYFVREAYYAVGGGLIYAFDGIYGVWTVLGAG